MRTLSLIIWEELPDDADRAKAIIEAMTLSEENYLTPPENEYQELDNEVLGRLLRVFNDPAPKQANGDIFGRIYDYFSLGLPTSWTWRLK